MPKVCSMARRSRLIVVSDPVFKAMQQMHEDMEKMAGGKIEAFTFARPPFPSDLIGCLLSVRTAASE